MIPAEPIISDAFILKMKADLFDASEIKIQTPSLHVINKFLKVIAKTLTFCDDLSLFFSRAIKFYKINRKHGTLVRHTQTFLYSFQNYIALKLKLS